MPMFDAVLRCGWQAHSKKKDKVVLELAACETLASQTCEEPYFDRRLRLAFQRVDGPAS